MEDHYDVMGRDFRRQDAAAGAKPKRTRMALSQLISEPLPEATEAETAVIAGMLNGDSVLRDALAAAVKPQHFMPGVRQELWKKCLGAYRAGGTVEPVAVVQALIDGGMPRDDAVDLVDQYWQQGVLAVHADWYASNLAGVAALRDLIMACTKSLSEAYACPRSPDAIDALFSETVAALQKAQGAGAEDTAETMQDGTARLFEDMERRAESADVLTGVPSGYADLDDVTGGWQDTDLIIVAARPAMGKTAFALNVALNAAAAGKKVLAFSLEMSALQLRSRLLAILSGVDVSTLRTPSLLSPAAWDRLYAAGGVLRRLPIWIDDRSGLRPSQIRAACRKRAAAGGLDLVIVDYLQLMQADGRTLTDEQRCGEISRALKALAKDLQVPVIALAQLNRELERRDDRRPMLSDLRSSGSIEQDADLVLFVHRDDVYARRRDGLRPIDSYADIIIGKHRNGPVGTVKLLYTTTSTAFSTLLPSWKPAA